MATHSLGNEMKRETREVPIENQIMADRGILGYPESLVIRRCQLGRYGGTIDIVFFAGTTSSSIALVEVKLGTSAPARSKVVDQLLRYRSSMLERIGSHGLRQLKRFAVNQPSFASSTQRKTLKALTGGISPPDAAGAALREGDPIMPSQLDLFIGLDCEPSSSLLAAIKAANEEHSVDIKVVTATPGEALHVHRVT